jgi:hypothetical protein
MEEEEKLPLAAYQMWYAARGSFSSLFFEIQRIVSLCKFSLWDHLLRCILENSVWLILALLS